MSQLPAIFASVHFKDDAHDDPEDTRSYNVTVQPFGAPDHAVAGHLRIGSPSGIEVVKLDVNDLGIGDELAGKLLTIVLNGLLHEVNELDGLGAEYHSPDCSAWINRTLYRGDASRVIRALATHAKVFKPIVATLLVTQ